MEMIKIICERMDTCGLIGRPSFDFIDIKKEAEKREIK
jgi:hypothetical protein